jgi:hypothetical protein
MATQFNVGTSQALETHHFSEDGKCPCCHSPRYATAALHEECRECGFAVDWDQEAASEH